MPEPSSSQAVREQPAELDRDDPDIGDDQVVFRRIAGIFVIQDENLQRPRPSTRAFRQAELSVYLSSMTTPDMVASEGTEPYIVAINVGILRQLGLGIILDPSSGGPGHCLVTGRRTRSKLNQIVKQAEWVEGFAP